MSEDVSPAALVDARIAAIGGWRGETLARLRALIAEALPERVEGMKWKKSSNPAGAPTFLSAAGRGISG